MSKIKLALVSYINTTPFIEGIKLSKTLSEKVELFIDYPAKCAEMILNKKVDGGLLPVGAYKQDSELEIVSNYCIGASGPVDTVALFSHQDLKSVKTIFLDYQSKTSVQLVRILAQKYWKQEFEFLPTEAGFENKIPEDSAILIIGDRVFDFEHLYPFKIDLAKAWLDFTQLPFAFAIWAGNKKVKNIEDELNTAFKNGIERIPELYDNLLTIDKDTFINYLTKKIDFDLDNRKREAIQLFTSMLITR